MSNNVEGPRWATKRGMSLLPKWKYWWRWYVGSVVGLIVGALCLVVVPFFRSVGIWFVGAVSAATTAGVEHLLTRVFPPPPPSWLQNSPKPKG